MLFARIARLAAVAVGVALALCAGGPAQAKKAFAEKEKVACDYCHVTPGGPRNFRGLYYRKYEHSFANFDNAYEAKLAGVDPGSKGGDAVPTVKAYPNVEVKIPDLLKFTVKDIDGKPVNLARYAGDVILIVNVASKCGNTPQYKSLEALYQKYKEKGFVVLGFPANEFGMQEPGSDKEIKEFCTATYNVKFPMFAKTVVKGEDISPLYKKLTDKEASPKTGGDIEWNFAKFLVNRKGEVVARIPARTDPMKPDVVEMIEKELKEPKAEAEEK